MSVLEGGYSVRALISGTLAHVAGLAGVDADEEWWDSTALDEVGAEHPMVSEPALISAQAEKILKMIGLSTRREPFICHHRTGRAVDRFSEGIL